MSLGCFRFAYGAARRNTYPRRIAKPGISNPGRVARSVAAAAKRTGFDPIRYDWNSGTKPHDAEAACRLALYHARRAR